MVGFIHIAKIKKKKYYRSLFVLDKRQRFALQTTVLTAGLLIAQLIWEDYRFIMVGVLAATSYIFTAWSLTEDVRKMEWLYLFILPVLFTASVSLFYFLLPPRWIFRLSTVIVFGIGIYATLLIENIYNVAIHRSIQLLRVAQSVGLLITLVVMFFSSNVIFSLKTHFFINMLFIMPISFLLALQSLWSMKLENNLSVSLVRNALVVTLAIGQVAAILSFWPIPLTTASLFIASSFYCLVSIMQHAVVDRLFPATIREFIIVFVFTFFVTLATASWG